MVLTFKKGWVLGLAFHQEVSFNQGQQLTYEVEIINYATELIMNNWF